MRPAPKFFLLSIGDTSQPLRFWTLEESMQHVSDNARLALMSEHLELITDAGLLVFNKQQLRKAAKRARFGKWQVLFLSVLAVALLMNHSHGFYRYLGLASLLGIIYCQLAPDWAWLSTKIGRLRKKDR